MRMGRKTLHYKKPHATFPSPYGPKSQEQRLQFGQEAATPHKANPHHNHNGNTGEGRRGTTGLTGVRRPP
jgi:hypothetical protein